MAEFCLKCFNEMNDTDYKEDDIWLDEDSCEGCANWRPCVLELYPKPVIWRLVDAMRNLFCKKNMLLSKCKKACERFSLFII